MITIISAWDQNRLIGKGNTLPWYLPEDFKHFKRTTLDHVIIMGRATWDSIGRKPLPKRQNIVLSRSISEKKEGVHYFANLEWALFFASTLFNDNRDIFIIGGAKLYQETLNKNLVQKMIVTHVHGSHDGDVYFPDFDESQWTTKTVFTSSSHDIVEYYKKESL